MKLKTLLLTLLISTSLIGTSQALTFVNSSSNNNSSKSTQSTKVDVAKSGISIENDPNLDFFKLPQKPPYPTEELIHGYHGRIADFNNDGLTDVIYIGAMHTLDNSGNNTGTMDFCGEEACRGINPPPTLYLSGTDGKLHYSPELLIDNRDNKGMSQGRVALVADYNNDKVLDIYIADNGLGEKDGYRDTYYLSQPNGTWLESSNTHLSHDNFKVYDHGGATGDIDNDGDMDIVITAMSAGFWCLMNDGTGFLKKHKCGGSFAFALELADMDNDGDLDAIVGGYEYNAYDPMFTGIFWNDGRGNFNNYNKTRLPQHKKKWGGIPEVSASDLDNDGDMDIVYSRQWIGRKNAYKGAAIQIIENLGNKKFKDYGVIPLFEGPVRGFIMDIRFRDFDKDGDIDVYLVSTARNTNGAVIINNGDFNFSLIMPPKSYELYKKLDRRSVVIQHTSAPIREMLRKIRILNKKLYAQLKTRKNASSNSPIKFESSIKKNGKVSFEGANKFTKFDIGIPLSSGALLVGFKDLKVLNDNKVNVRAHIKHGNIDFSVGICFEYHPQNTFMAARTSFGNKDWGGLKKVMPSSRCIGKWELDDNKSKLEELGVYAVMDDIQQTPFEILKALDDNSTIDLSKIRSLQNK